MFIYKQTCKSTVKGKILASRACCPTRVKIWGDLEEALPSEVSQGEGGEISYDIPLCVERKEMIPQWACLQNRLTDSENGLMVAALRWGR